MWRFVSLTIALVLLSEAHAQDVIPPTSTPTTVAVTDVTTPGTPPPASCFNVPEEECPPWKQSGGQPSKTRCKKVAEDAILCCHLSSMFELKEQVAGVIMPVVRLLHVRNATLRELDVSFVSSYTSLESLSITEGNITRITGRFPPNITCLNLTGNALSDIEDNALSPLGRLNMLDISHNNLTKLPAINTTTAVEHFWLDISGANKLPCSGIHQIISKMENNSCSLYFLHKNDTFCYLVVAYWFNNTEKVPIAQIEQQYKLIEGCPFGTNFKCTCNIHRVDIPMGSTVTYSVAVDCSGQQLTALPDQLPLETVALNVSNNNISNLVQLSGTMGSGYSKIREFDGDNNRISSISVLEGSDFINNFARLSIKYNNLSVIPTYFLSSRFDRNDVTGWVFLGGNKIECNCDTVPLKDWLQANKLHVRDYDEILCKNLEISVVDLERSKVCMHKHVWTDYIYYIIAGEVALLLMLVGKVSYDYWVFKTAGYLPWPASKMPKLPCDWVFET